MQSEPLTPELRAEFIAIRTELFQRGVFDPVLARFDSHTVPRASAEDAGRQLEQLAAANF
jgi:hypothetical protein